MSGSLASVLVLLAVYVGGVLALGMWAARRSASTPEDYYLAGRKLGMLVLFMALFGTNNTSFVLVGIPGRAYHDGIAAFGLNVPLVALLVPLSFWLIGLPARQMAARLGALTPAELYTRRFDSRPVGLVLFGLFTAYTLPYMVQAIVGAAVVLSGATGEALPRWAIGLAIVTLSLVYTGMGGMRATAWTNVVQGAIFMVFMLAGIGCVAASFGGFGAAMRAVEQHAPTLLEMPRRGLYEPGAWTSWGLVISLTVIAFPHMFARLMSARDERALRGVVRIYPLALLALWLPAVLLGLWGAVAFPGLEGAESDRIFTLMTTERMPAAIGTLGFLAVLAAVMSTVDAMLLTLGSMLARDVVGKRRGESTGSEVKRARLFVVLIAAVAYLLAQTWGESIFAISRIAFEGYTTLVPALLLGVRWRRFTAAGAIASMATGAAVLIACRVAGITELLGFLPAFWALLGAFGAALAVSWLTPPAAPELTALAFGTAEVDDGSTSGSGRRAPPRHDDGSPGEIC